MTFGILGRDPAVSCTCRHTNIFTTLCGYVVSGKGPEICDISGSFISTGGLSFNLAWVMLLKCLKIGGW